MDCHANSAPGIGALIRRASHFTGLCFLNSDEPSGGDWGKRQTEWALSLWRPGVSGAGHSNGARLNEAGTGAPFSGRNQVSCVDGA